jgi:hypothetical protein
MTLGEEGHTVYVSLHKGVRKGLRVKIGGDAGDVRGGVEVEMDLALVGDEGMHKG